MTVRFVPSEDLPEPKRLRDVELSDDRVFRSHLRIAMRFEERYAGQFVYMDQVGWYFWDGVRWAESMKGEVERALFDLLRESWADAMQDTTLQQDVRAAQSASGTAGVLTQASKLKSFAFVAADFDTDPYLLNTPGGTIDLRTFVVRPHDPSDRITKVTRAAVDWGAQAPTWDRVLSRILPDEEVREFLQRYVGLALVGKVIEHALVILLGPGGNGKGTFYQAVSWALGDYAITAEPELFMHKDGSHPTGQMDLFGRRWVVTSETEQGRRMATATVKRLTGGDPIRARRMHKDFVEFMPSHTAVLVTNHLPRITGDDPALWRRIRVVEFNVVIPPTEQDGHLDEALQLEADGILLWALRGYSEYTRRGLAEPDSVRNATGEYRDDSDDLARFLEEVCEVTPGVGVPFSELYAVWDVWRSANDGGPHRTKKALSRDLAAKGLVTRARGGNVKWVEGVRFRQ